mmetsp:Transcript_16780/g.52445  ORF Transcript_16780/g.52445 Transcript_16780/m.52445 type:complete len:344 (+) Transcript_16780:1141-2172(+)
MPASRSTSRHSNEPAFAARWDARSPDASTWSAAAPAPSSRRTTAWLPAAQADERGVQPRESTALTSAPAFSSSCTTRSASSGAPSCAAAACSGLASVSSTRLTDAPDASSRPTDLALPAAAAMASGVRPRTSGASTGKTAASRIVDRTSMAPSDESSDCSAATCSGDVSHGMSVASRADSRAATAPARSCAVTAALSAACSGASTWSLSDPPTCMDAHSSAPMPSSTFGSGATTKGKVYTELRSQIRVRSVSRCHRLVAFLTILRAPSMVSRRNSRSRCTAWRSSARAAASTEPSSSLCRMSRRSRKNTALARPAPASSDTKNAVTSLPLGSFTVLISFFRPS